MHVTAALAVTLVAAACAVTTPGTGRTWGSTPTTASRSWSSTRSPTTTTTTLLETRRSAETSRRPRATSADGSTTLSATTRRMKSTPGRSRTGAYARMLNGTGNASRRQNSATGEHGLLNETVSGELIRDGGNGQPEETTGRNRDIVFRRPLDRGDPAGESPPEEFLLDLPTGLAGSATSVSGVATSPNTVEISTSHPNVSNTAPEAMTRQLTENTAQNASVSPVRSPEADPPHDQGFAAQNKLFAPFLKITDTSRSNSPENKSSSRASTDATSLETILPTDSSTRPMQWKVSDGELLFQQLVSNQSMSFWKTEITPAPETIPNASTPKLSAVNDFDHNQAIASADPGRTGSTTDSTFPSEHVNVVPRKLTDRRNFFSASGELSSPPIVVFPKGRNMEHATTPISPYSGDRVLAKKSTMSGQTADNFVTVTIPTITKAFPLPTVEIVTTKRLEGSGISVTNLNIPPVAAAYQNNTLNNTAVNSEAGVLFSAITETSSPKYPVTSARMKTAISVDSSTTPPLPKSFENEHTDTAKELTSPRLRSENISNHALSEALNPGRKAIVITFPKPRYLALNPNETKEKSQQSSNEDSDQAARLTGHEALYKTTTVQDLISSRKSETSRSVDITTTDSTNRLGGTSTAAVEGGKTKGSDPKMLLTILVSYMNQTRSLLNETIPVNPETSNNARPLHSHSGFKERPKSIASALLQMPNIEEAVHNFILAILPIKLHDVTSSILAHPSIVLDQPQSTLPAHGTVEQANKFTTSPAKSEFMSYETTAGTTSYLPSDMIETQDNTAQRHSPSILSKEEDSTELNQNEKQFSSGESRVDDLVDKIQNNNEGLDLVPEKHGHGTVKDPENIVVYTDSGDCSPELAGKISTLESRAGNEDPENQVVVEMNCKQPPEKPPVSDDFTLTSITSAKGRSSADKRHSTIRSVVSPTDIKFNSANTHSSDKGRFHLIDKIHTPKKKRRTSDTKPFVNHTEKTLTNIKHHSDQNDGRSRHMTRTERPDLEKPKTPITSAFSTVNQQVYVLHADDDIQIENRLDARSTPAMSRFLKRPPGKNGLRRITRNAVDSEADGHGDSSKGTEQPQYLSSSLGNKTTQKSHYRSLTVMDNARRKATRPLTSNGMSHNSITVLRSSTQPDQILKEFEDGTGQITKPTENSHEDSIRRNTDLLVKDSDVAERFDDLGAVFSKQANNQMGVDVGEPKLNNNSRSPAISSSTLAGKPTQLEFNSERKGSTANEAQKSTERQQDIPRASSQNPTDDAATDPPWGFLKLFSLLENYGPDIPKSTLPAENKKTKVQVNPTTSPTSTLQPTQRTSVSSTMQDSSQDLDKTRTVRKKSQVTNKLTPDESRQTATSKLQVKVNDQQQTATSKLSVTSNDMQQTHLITANEMQQTSKLVTTYDVLQTATNKLPVTLNDQQQTASSKLQASSNVLQPAGPSRLPFTSNEVQLSSELVTTTLDGRQTILNKLLVTSNDAQQTATSKIQFLVEDPSTASPSMRDKRTTDPPTTDFEQRTAVVSSSTADSSTDTTLPTVKPSKAPRNAMRTKRPRPSWSRAIEADLLSATIRSRFLRGTTDSVEAIFPQYDNVEDMCENLCKPKQRVVCAQVGSMMRTFNSLCEVKIEGCLVGGSTKILHTGSCNKYRKRKTKVIIEQEEEIPDDMPVEINTKNTSKSPLFNYNNNIDLD